MLAGVSLLIISLLSATLPPGWHGVPSALAKAGGNGKGNGGTPVVMKRTAMMQRRHPRRTRKNDKPGKTVQKFYQNPTGRFMLEDTSIQ